ncbi:MAG TPA: ABC transporter ATP-binding protein [Dehalococcoidia bacterium]|nr:ABC transporter ATP-binding protein [Dehalococcoidia bacterium]
MSGEKIGLRGITVERGKRCVLDVPQLTLAPGELMAVVGPNGAGKSTLAQVMALLVNPSRGEVVFEGATVRGSPLTYRRRMAMVFQESLLLDTSVEGNVGVGLAVRGVAAAERRQRVDKWLERFGIAHLARRSARTLSGGEAQRASLARALVLEPEVLFLDEPFAALDAPTRSSLIDDLDRALAGSEITTLFVTHDRSEALRLGDRIAVLMDGAIRQIGTPAEVFATPADEQVAAFVGVETITPGRVRTVADGIAVVDVAGRAIEANAGGQLGDDVLVCLRPEDVVLAPLSESGQVTSARNKLVSTVRRITPAGPHASVAVDAGFPLVALITKQSLEDLGLEPGSTVVASFKATAVHLIPHRQHPAD